MPPRAPCFFGARIKSLTDDSGAEKAGLKAGDIITKIDNETVKEDGDVARAIRARKPGDKVKVTIIRDGKEQVITAELTAWRGVNFGHRFNMNDFNVHVTPPAAPSVPHAYGAVYGRPRLGISIQDTEDGKGVKVQDVDEDTPAEKAGLKENDIITKVDDEAVNSTDDLRRITSRARQGSTFTFTVLRDGKEQKLEVKFPRKLKSANL